ncbi:MAG: hypothetical protein MZV70_08125 [Desulfobacterales bacterium]|nr:hypothetical protein [Desulfobacterales bacterium]
MASAASFLTDVSSEMLQNVLPALPGQRPRRAHVGGGRGGGDRRDHRQRAQALVRVALRPPPGPEVAGRDRVRDLGGGEAVLPGGRHLAGGGRHPLGGPGGEGRARRVHATRSWPTRSPLTGGDGPSASTGPPTPPARSSGSW